MNVEVDDYISGRVLDGKTHQMKTFSSIVVEQQPHSWGVSVLTMDGERVTVSNACLDTMKINGKVR